jgi:hypothetical protein
MPCNVLQSLLRIETKAMKRARTSKMMTTKTVTMTTKTMKTAKFQMIALMSKRGTNSSRVSVKNRKITCRKKSSNVLQKKKKSSAVRKTSRNVNRKNCNAKRRR